MGTRKIDNIGLYVDFGSTFTKVVVIDLNAAEVISRAQVVSTVDTDITIGLKQALRRIKADVNIENLEEREALACSSAAGGLRIVAVGFVPELSSEAATRAALGAGGKIVGRYSYELNKEEVNDIEEALPDIILLSGGTNGGDKGVIIHNAHMLSSLKSTRTHIVVAGNKAAHDEVRAIFDTSAKRVSFIENVMPEINILNIEPCNKEIRGIFLKHIVEVKGIAKARAMLKDIIMPTPTAVLSAAKLLAEGYGEHEGLHDTVVVDVGGATTDVCSITKGNPSKGNVALTGLPEPYAKRTVEGDLGLRSSMSTLMEYLRARGVLLNNSFEQLARKLSLTDRLPEREEEFAFDKVLASFAVEIAMERHAGKIDIIYGPQGEMLIQRGKDLTEVRSVVGTGGPIVFSTSPRDILETVLFQERNPSILRPRNPKFYVDEQYILYAAGLLSQVNPKSALNLMKKYIKEVK